MAETTRRILRHVFAISLAKQLNFAGRGQKHSELRTITGLTGCQGDLGDTEAS